MSDRPGRQRWSLIARALAGRARVLTLPRLLLLAVLAMLVLLLRLMVSLHRAADPAQQSVVASVIAASRHTATSSPPQQALRDREATPAAHSADAAESPAQRSSETSVPPLAVEPRHEPPQSDVTAPTRIWRGLAGAATHSLADVTLQSHALKRRRARLAAPGEPSGAASGLKPRRRVDMRRALLHAMVGAGVQAMCLPLWFEVLVPHVPGGDFRGALARAALSWLLLTPLLLSSFFVHLLEDAAVRGAMQFRPLLLQGSAVLAAFPLEASGALGAMLAQFLAGFGARLPPWALGLGAGSASALCVVAFCLRVLRKGGGVVDAVLLGPEAEGAAPQAPDVEEAWRRHAAALAAFDASTQCGEGRQAPRVVATLVAEGAEGAACGAPSPGGGSRLPAGLPPTDREQLLAMIRRSAPPLIREFMEANIGLLDLPAPEARAATAFAPDAATAVQPEFAAPQGESDEDSGAFPVAAYEPGSFGAIAAVLHGT